MNVIGRFRRRLLEQRRSPYQVKGLVCQACTKAKGTLQHVVKARVLYQGIFRPGVQCPRCHLSWIEQEEQPKAIAQ